jgi:hypothetical protein
MKKKICIIGLGFVSQYAYISSLKFNKKVEIVAISDKNESFLRKVANKFGIENYYKDYRQIFKSHKIDAAFIIVEKENYFEIIKHILSKKIHVFSEKPGSISSFQIKKLINISKKKKVFFYIGYMKKFDKGIEYLKKKIDANAFGKIISVIYKSYDGDSYCSPNQYLKKKIQKRKIGSSYSRFLNSNSHSVNLLRFLFGDLKFRYKQISPSGEGIIFFNGKINNCNIVLNNRFSHSVKWIEEIDVNFENFYVKIEMPPPFLRNVNSEIKIIKLKTGNILRPFFPYTWSFNEQSKYFIDNLYNKKIIRSDEYTKDFKLIENLFL